MLPIIDLQKFLKLISTQKIINKIYSPTIKNKYLEHKLAKKLFRE